MRTIWFTMLTLVVAGAPFIFAAEQAITVEGTLVSSACYLGPRHQTGNDMGTTKNCGSDCLQKGDPAGLVSKDKEFHVLVVSSIRLAPYVGQQVRVTGTDHNGAIRVEKV